LVLVKVVEHNLRTRMDLTTNTRGSITLSSLINNHTPQKRKSEKDLGSRRKKWK
jgi:hypothetical protein